MPRLFCFGYGYSARALAKGLGARGWTVAGTCRTPEKAEKLGRDGIDSVIFSPGHPIADIDAVMAGVTHLLISVPPSEDGDPVLVAHGADLARLAKQFDWAGYLSTTGVYGDRGGAWVGESSALTPTTERGRRRLAAEQAWLALHQAHGLPVHLFRLAGIYGPGRNALETLKAGTARRIDKPGQIFSRIHVADIAGALAASIDWPNPGQAYNLCDNEPAPPAKVIEYAADLLDIDPPPLVPFDKANLSPMARSFYADSKKVSNTRIKDELGYTLEYPGFRDGLQALLAG